MLEVRVEVQIQLASRVLGGGENARPSWIENWSRHVHVAAIPRRGEELLFENLNAEPNQLRLSPLIAQVMVSPARPDATLLCVWRCQTQKDVALVQSSLKAHGFSPHYPLQEERLQ